MGDPLYIAIGVGLVVFVAFVGIFLKIIARRGGGSDHDTLVRSLVSQGEFEQAADLQLQAGKQVEALNLLVRGEVHGRASELASELGKLDKAALHAEKATRFEKAADLYARIEDYTNAGRLYQRTGQFRKAAEAMERNPDIAVEVLAQMWENACLELMPKDGKLSGLPRARVGEITYCAGQAADAWKRAGKNDKAATFYEISRNKRAAAQARKRNPSALKASMEASMEASPGLGGGDGDMDWFGGSGDDDDEGEPMGGWLPNEDDQDSQDITTALIGGRVDVELSDLGEALTNAVKEALIEQPTFNLVASTSPGHPGEHTDGMATNAPAIGIVYVPDPETMSPTPVTRESERYTIEEKIGEGGMAVVFRAVDRVLERDVALKFLPEGYTQNPTSLRFFEREAKAAAGISHPNVVTIYDYGVLDNRPFICMELVEGYALNDRLDQYLDDEAMMPIDEILDLCEGILSGLEAVHKRQVVHRDLKPSNIMISEDGVVKLMDFGIAGQLNPDKSTMIVGTPRYMAPEQFFGKGIDHRTDLFAFGVTVYMLLTGEAPFDAMDRMTRPPMPHTFRTDIPRSLEQLVMGCIKNSPEARPDSAGEVLLHLKDVRSRLDQEPYAEPEEDEWDDDNDDDEWNDETEVDYGASAAARMAGAMFSSAPVGGVAGGSIFDLQEESYTEGPYEADIQPGELAGVDLSADESEPLDLNSMWHAVASEPSLEAHRARGGGIPSAPPEELEDALRAYLESSPAIPALHGSYADDDDEDWSEDGLEATQAGLPNVAELYGLRDQGQAAYADAPMGGPERMAYQPREADAPYDAGFGQRPGTHEGRPLQSDAYSPQDAGVGHVYDSFDDVSEDDFEATQAGIPLSLLKEANDNNALNPEGVMILRESFDEGDIPRGRGDSTHFGPPSRAVRRNVSGLADPPPPASTRPVPITSKPRDTRKTRTGPITRDRKPSAVEDLRITRKKSGRVEVDSDAQPAENLDDLLMNYLKDS